MGLLRRVIDMETSSSEDGESENVAASSESESEAASSYDEVSVGEESSNEEEDLVNPIERLPLQPVIVLDELPLGKTPQKMLLAVNLEDKKLAYVIEWKNDDDGSLEPGIIRSEAFQIQYPEIVIAFYEKNLKFSNSYEESNAASRSSESEDFDAEGIQKEHLETFSTCADPNEASTILFEPQTKIPEDLTERDNSSDNSENKNRRDTNTNETISEDEILDEKTGAWK